MPAIITCFRCQRYPDEGESSFPRCGRCKTRSYCSQDCQRRDWKDHKKECKAIAEGRPPPERVRTTFRTTLADLDSGFGTESPASLDSDCIYYLRTSKPYIKDISISGPFYPADSIIEQMKGRLTSEGSTEGLHALEEIVRTTPVRGIQHLNAPLPSGHVMTLQICPEKNAQVANALRNRASDQPVATYSVYYMTPDPDFDDSDDDDDNGPEYVPVVDAAIHATFLSKEAANSSAGELLARWKREKIGLDTGSLPQPGGLRAGYLLGANGRMERIVEVRFDDGRKKFSDGTIRY